jgi:hypothetical protein
MSAFNKKPLVLDFDRSAGAIAGASFIDLAEWQEEIRFGCTLKTFNKLRVVLDASLPAEYGTVLLGSGDYHHLSWPLIERCKDRGPFQVVLFDNHPDNMRFPFGVHCGSWVRKVAMLPYVSHVHVLGITSGDIGLAHAWENYWRPLMAGKLTYWSMDVDVSWARYVGLGSAFRSFPDPDTLIAEFLATQKEAGATYLTIDKDVLAEEAVQTNWDQGCMLEPHLLSVIEALRGKIIGSDITGEVSSWQYVTKWKKHLSAMDGQDDIPQEKLDAWQVEQQVLNQRLLAAITDSSR